MSVPDISADEIAANANAPQSASVDGQTAAQVPIPDQILAAEYAAKAATAAESSSNGGRKSGWRGLRPAQAVMPGHT